MTGREKVIRAVETCFDSWIDKHRNMGLDLHEVERLKREALEMLKEKEPRLLTIEEITGDGECWFEGINGAYGYADCYMCTGSKEVEVNRISMKPEYVSWDDFKKKWRCWSYRPTDD